MQKKLKSEKKTADKELILNENNLRLIETGFFRSKQTISKVKNAKGTQFILKTGRIDPYQQELLMIAKSLESNLFFKVPAVEQSGDGWLLLQEIEGKPLYEFYEEKPEWCVEVCKKISDDYQRVLEVLQKERSLGGLAEGGKEWLFDRLKLWSQPIVEAKFIHPDIIEELRRDFEKRISEKGEAFFGWAHGNIIGDHIIVSGDDLYLLDPNAVSRVGRGYYDFLRALDFMLLKSKDGIGVIDAIPRWMKKYLPDFEEEEVRLIFAFRNIGILGWDVLHGNVEYMAGDMSKKKEAMLRFIQREC